MKNSPDNQKAVEMRQVESVLMEAVLMIASVGDYKDFTSTDEGIRFEGASASAEVDKTNGALRIYLKGKSAPIYDSRNFDDCINLDQAWDVAFQLTTEIQSAVCKSSPGKR